MGADPMKRKIQLTNRFVAIMVLAVLFASGGPARVEAAKFEFNPANFFDFLTVDGFTEDGGMFGLSRDYFNEPPTPGVNNFGSWIASERPYLDALKVSMDANGGGIGYIEVYLPKSTGANNWGQTLTTSDEPTGTAPAGWTALGSFDVGDAWLFEWQADAFGPTFNFLSPSDDIGNFSLSFTPNEPVSIGIDYTIWFGAVNEPNFGPDAISFNSGSAGPVSWNPFDSEPDTGYQATLSLAIVPLPGDINLDDRVDRTDAAELVRQLGSEEGTWITGDFDGDGVTGLSDLELLRANLGITASPAASQIAVPEPTTLTLLWLGVSSLFAMRFRHRRVRSWATG